MSTDAPNPATLIAATVALFALATSAAHAEQARVTSVLPLKQVATVVLPGSSTRFDYMSIDTNARRLYISHMNGDELLVFDLRRRKVIAQIPAPGVHGVLAVPQLGRVFASATNAREVLTIDAHNESIIARAPAGLYPDGIAYDPRERHVFVSDESGGVETVIDARGPARCDDQARRRCRQRPIRPSLRNGARRCADAK